MKFRKCWNNGVLGVVTEDTYRKIEERTKTMEEMLGRNLPVPPIPLPTPIFTFSDLPHLRIWVTGTLVDSEELLKGHELERGWFYVPFSNGEEIMRPRKPEIAMREWQLRTTLREAMDTFGLDRRDRR